MIFDRVLFVNSAWIDLKSSLGLAGFSDSTSYFSHGQSLVVADQDQYRSHSLPVEDLLVFQPFIFQQELIFDMLELVNFQDNVVILLTFLFKLLIIWHETVGLLFSFLYLSLELFVLNIQELAVLAQRLQLIAENRYRRPQRMVLQLVSISHEVTAPIRAPFTTF